MVYNLPRSFMSSQTQSLYQPTDELKLEEGVYKTRIPGLFYLKRKSFPDKRGFFAEVGHAYKIEKLIKKPFIIKQINHSRSVTNVLRGMHTEDWKKLATITCGVAFCALADVRPDSPTFKTVESFMLGYAKDALPGSLFIEEGIANSICTIKGPVDYIYCVDRLYKDRDPKGDVAISLFDPDLNINWPIPKDKMILSDRDINSVTLRQKFPNKFK